MLITREDDGYTFEINGKTIRMPSFDSDGDFNIHVQGDAASDIHVVKHKIGGPGPMGGTVIISGKPIDAATQDAIRATLQSAGHDGEVTFIDRELQADGERHVKIIKKRVEVTK